MVNGSTLLPRLGVKISYLSSRALRTPPTKRSHWSCEALLSPATRNGTVAGKDLSLILSRASSAQRFKIRI